MASKDVIVIAGCTHREGFLDEYEAKLAKADIPFHLEQLDSLPYGANSITMQRRIDYWRKMASQFIDYSTIYITDGWDVLCWASKQELIDKAPETFICSAERNAYPEAHLADRITGSTPWWFANNGCIAANPQYLIEWCDEAEHTPDMDILDQGWFNRRLAEGSHLTPLDVTTNLFYVVSEHLEDGALQVKDGRPWNSVCQTFPAWLHFSGKCPDSKVRKMLADGEGALY